MLSVPGRTPLLTLYETAHRFIWNRFNEWVDAQTPVGPIPTDWDGYEWDWSNTTPAKLVGADFDVLTANIRMAAKLCCVNLARRKGGQVEILTPFGATPSAPISIFGKPAVATFAGTLHNAIVPATFWTDEWPPVFFEGLLFSELESCLLNWAVGTVDVGLLEYAASAARARRQSAGTGDGHRPDGDGLLTMLRPYHGCPIIVPEEWLSDFAEKDPPFETEALSSEVDLPWNFNSLSPAEKIVAFSDRNPTANKEAIRNAVLPHFSIRQFGLHFAQAGQKKPTLRRPGRKPSKKE